MGGKVLIIDDDPALLRLMSMEGIGAIRAIKQSARPPKVIAISGAGRTRGADYLGWARHLGADAVLAKPFRMSELMKISKSVIANENHDTTDLGA